MSPKDSKPPRELTVDAIFEPTNPPELRLCGEPNPAELDAAVSRLDARMAKTLADADRALLRSRLTGIVISILPCWCGMERRDRVEAWEDCPRCQFAKDLVDALEKDPPPPLLTPAELATVRGALEFYANKDNWRELVETPTGLVPCPYLGGPAVDDGERARAVLTLLTSKTGAR